MASEKQKTKGEKAINNIIYYLSHQTVQPPVDIVHAGLE